MSLSDDGYVIVSGQLNQSECHELREDVEQSLRRFDKDSIESIDGGLVGGRNLIDRWDGWERLINRPAIGQLVQEQLGSSAGLVRVLYFDKPPGQGWSLSLHRDQTIAVSEHHESAAPFSKPTVKAGVPHVVATTELLQRMLTLRWHLDPMNDENGPLTVVPGSHLDPQRTCQQPCSVIHCGAGDVFVMRPLLLHGSRAPKPETTMHRRVLHLELAPTNQLPSPYRWHRFVPIPFQRVSSPDESNDST